MVDSSAKRHVGPQVDLRLHPRAEAADTLSGLLLRGAAGTATVEEFLRRLLTPAPE